MWNLIICEPRYALFVSAGHVFGGTYRGDGHHVDRDARHVSVFGEHMADTIIYYADRAGIV